MMRTWTLVPGTNNGRHFTQVRGDRPVTPVEVVALADVVRLLRDNGAPDLAGGWRDAADFIEARSATRESE